jgi:hypothetical protein
MLTTITAEPWEIFSTHFLPKRAHKCKKIQKFEKVTSRVRMRNRKNHRNLKIILLKSCIVPSGVSYNSLTQWHVKNEVSVMILAYILPNIQKCSC